VKARGGWGKWCGKRLPAAIISWEGLDWEALIENSKRFSRRPEREQGAQKVLRMQGGGMAI